MNGSASLLQLQTSNASEHARLTQVRSALHYDCAQVPRSRRHQKAGEDGVPPNLIDQNWLWVEFGGELLDADMNGVYELEPVAGTGPPWVYVWAPGSNGSMRRRNPPDQQLPRQ
jgi:hypothetical protein